MGVRVHGLGFRAPDPRPGNKDSRQTDTLTHPQALGTDHCGACAFPARCGRAPGVRRVLESLSRFVLNKKKRERERLIESSMEPRTEIFGKARVQQPSGVSSFRRGNRKSGLAAMLEG